VNTYQSNLGLADAARLIKTASTRGPITVITHAKPDGDAMGCVVALVAALRQLQIPATGMIVPPIPANLVALADGVPIDVYEDHCRGDLNSLLSQAGLIVVVDTGAWSQLGPLRSAIEPRVRDVLILDHHLSGDIPAANRFIDGTAAACAEIIAQLLDFLADRPRITDSDRRIGRIGTRANDWKNHLFTPTVLDALFAGLASDTGWFRFSNTRPATHELAARLLRQGVDQAELYAQLEQTERPQKLALLIRALDSLKLLADGRVAVMTLRSHDFVQTDSLPEETERFVDVPQAVASVRVVILVTEPPVGGNGNGESAGGDPTPAIRVSFRSKPGPEAVNVADLAAQFGGGGHARAAGAKIKAPFDDVLRRLEQAALALFTANV
jgi:phosphoesterase RecJ-like protein